MIDLTIKNPASNGEIFDSHAHYDDAKFDGVRDELIAALPKYGVGGVINCGINLLESAAINIELCRKYDFFYSAFGIHPECVGNKNPFDEEKLTELLKTPKAVAVGEIGLDYHWNSDNKAAQIACFKDQLNLAKKLNMPAIIHDREAHADTYEILSEIRPRGVVHCFSGSDELARQIVNLGLYIGVGGVATFKNAKKLVSVIENLPLEKLLLETDAPYMAPEPLRGTLNCSAYICFVAEKIAEIKGVSRETVFAASRQNVKNLFGI